jgi:ABC-type phosphate transport system substrate-binding protein
VAIAACGGSGQVSILGSSFSSVNVTISGGYNLVFSTFEENVGNGRVNLTYSGSEIAPFFSITTGEVTFGNLTISLSSANKGSFVALTGFFFLPFSLS